jgi:hypothetical protein
MTSDVINIYLAGPRGFCAGVERAILMVEESIKKYGGPIYVRHEIVHNKYVVEDLKVKGKDLLQDLTPNIPFLAVSILCVEYDPGKKGILGVKSCNKSFPFTFKSSTTYLL